MAGALKATGGIDRARIQPSGDRTNGPEDSLTMRPVASVRTDRARPASRLFKTERCRRQGHLRDKAHRSHYVLLDVRRASRTLDATPLQGGTSPYTIDAATMRLCGADHPALRHPIADEPPYSRSWQVARAWCGLELVQSGIHRGDDRKNRNKSCDFKNLFDVVLQAAQNYLP